jgi:hypothetical protein
MLLLTLEMYTFAVALFVAALSPESLNFGGTVEPSLKIESSSP